MSKRVAIKGGAYRGLTFVGKLTNYVCAERVKILSVKDRPICRRIADIGRLFGVEPQRHGFQYVGAVRWPKMPRMQIWWPKVAERANDAGWKNELVIDNNEVIEIKEMNVKNKVKNDETIKKNIKEDMRRVVFANVDGIECDSGYCYLFIGVFELDKERTQREGGCIWTRIATDVELNPVVQDCDR